VFRKLTDLSYRRTPLEALGFYLFYLTVFLLLSASAHSLTAYFTADPEFAFRVSRFVGGLAATVLAMALLLAKGLTKRTGYVLLAFLAGLVTLATGGFFGLLVPAYLSSR
jgi:hypothetical protein